MKWVKSLEDTYIFYFTFSLPVTNQNWKEQILSFDEEFLAKSLKYSLLYFEPSILSEYRGVKSKNFFVGHDRQVALLDFNNHYCSNTIQFPDKYYIDVPTLDGDKFVYTKESFFNRYSTDKLLEFDSLIGAIHLMDIEDLVDYQDICVSVKFSSSSNIWLEEIEIGEDLNGKLHYLETPKNNSSWAYRIAPRFNSFLRDLKLKVEEQGGSAFLEEHNMKYVTEEGILLDGKIIYQEDIDEGRINLSDIDGLILC